MIGSKVKYSEKRLKTTDTANPNREGIIVNESKDKEQWAVLWEGNTKAKYVHKSFIQILK